MKKRKISLFLFLLVSMACMAQSNANGIQIADKIFKEGNYFNQAHTMPGNVFAIYKSIYNEVIAKNGYNRWGPRYIALDGKPQFGTVAGQTQRTFVSNPSTNGVVNVKVEKTDGKAKTSVMISVYSENGAIRSLPIYTFPNGNDKTTKNYRVTGVKDKIILVVVKNKSVGNQFKYKASAQ